MKNRKKTFIMARLSLVVLLLGLCAGCKKPAPAENPSNATEQTSFEQTKAVPQHNRQQFVYKSALERAKETITEQNAWKKLKKIERAINSHSDSTR